MQLTAKEPTMTTSKGDAGRSVRDASGHSVGVARRPRAVTAAAVLSFIWAGGTLVGSLISSVAAGRFVSSVGIVCDSPSGRTDLTGGAVCSATNALDGLLVVIGVVLIAAAVGLIWGGIVALSGTNARICVIVAVVLVLAHVIALVAGGGPVAFNIFGVIVPVLITMLLINGSSRAWFRANGGQAF